MTKYTITLTALLIIAIAVSGCENDAGTNALLGAGLGAGIGAIAGGDSSAIMTGAAIGGGAGYILGNESDKKTTQQNTDAQLAQIRAEQQIVSIWITNSNGSQTEVKLRRSGPNFIGPRGETYSSMPTQEQLKPIYGF